jgi:hypothetical protein
MGEFSPTSLMSSIITTIDIAYRSIPVTNATLVGSEDCLFLNVYAPANASNLPVLVWIRACFLSFHFLSFPFLSFPFPIMTIRNVPV